MRVCFRPYLNAGKRELLADYALPVSVIVMSFCGSFLFRQVRRKISFLHSDWSFTVYSHVSETKLFYWQWNRSTTMTVQCSPSLSSTSYRGWQCWALWVWASFSLFSSSLTRISPLPSSTAPKTGRPKAPVVFGSNRGDGRQREI